MAIKRGASIPQTPAAASKETPDAKPTAAAPATILQDHSAPASEPIPAATSAVPPPPISGAGTAVAAASGGPLAQRAPAVDDGFGALDNRLGFGSFPIVKLDKDLFYKGDAVIGKELFCAMLGIRPKYLYKEAGKQETEFLFYSYDSPATVSSGGGAETGNKLAAWTAQGIKHEVKEYMEVASQLYTKDGSDFSESDMVLLNIPPASVTRLAGYRMECRNFKHTALNRALTRCIPGEIVKVGKNTTFYPWQFEFVESLDG